MKEAFGTVMAIGRHAGDARGAAEAARAHPAAHADAPRAYLAEHERLVAHFEAALDPWCAIAHGAALPAFRTLAKSFVKWRAEIVGYARTGASNAFAEGINHAIKNQKRQAHGYPTWQGFRSQMKWCFAEVVDTCTGEILPLRFLTRGQGTSYSFTCST